MTWHRRRRLGFSATRLGCHVLGEHADWGSVSFYGTRFTPIGPLFGVGEQVRGKDSESVGTRLKKYSSFTKILELFYPRVRASRSTCQISCTPSLKYTTLYSTSPLRLSNVCVGISASNASCGVIK